MRPIVKHITARKEIYDTLNARDLTIDELRASKLPDAFLISIWVDFNSQAGKRYQTVHVRHPKPYILLSGLDKDENDFRYVEGIVSSETSGIPRGQIKNRETDICSYIDLSEDPTQIKVVDFAEKYSKNFKNVKVSSAYFSNVPRSNYENSGLPLEKLSLR